MEKQKKLLHNEIALLSDINNNLTVLNFEYSNSKDPIVKSLLQDFNDCAALLMRATKDIAEKQKDSKCL